MILLQYDHTNYITDRLMGSCFAIFHIKRHMKPSGKLMMICVKLTNPDPNLEINFEDLATTI